MYKQFTRETRIELAVLLRAKHATAECAKELGFHRSSVGREIKMNCGEDGIYRGAVAHKKYLEKRTVERRLAGR